MLSEMLQFASMDLGVFPALALVIFMTVFGLAAVHLFRMNKEHVTEMSRLPLDDDTPTPDREDR